VGNEELDVAEAPQVTNRCTAEVADERDVWNKDRGDEDEDERGCPGRDFVGTDAGTVLGFFI
jgi:hypothetical protein